MAALWVLSNDRSHTFRQAIESAAHVRCFAGHPDPRSLRTIHRLQTWQPHHSAASTTTNNARTAGRARPMPRHLHFQELCWRVFLQPLLPYEKVRPAQTVLTTKRFHTLSATCLLGNQTSPLYPGLLRALDHGATLQCHTNLYQMGFA